MPKVLAPGAVRPSYCVSLQFGVIEFGFQLFIIPLADYSHLRTMSDKHLRRRAGCPGPSIPKF